LAASSKRYRLNILEKIELEIDYNKTIDEQLDVLSNFDNISDSEINFILQHGHKSSEVGILIEYLGHDKLNAYLSKLLWFLADMNWPAAYGTANMLLASKEKILPEIKRIFIYENDGMWNYWVLNCIISKWDLNLIKNIRPELIHLIENDTNKFKDGVGILALKILYENNLVTDKEFEYYYKNLEKEYLSDIFEDWTNDLLDLKNASR